jgi:hypothetical protein
MKMRKIAYTLATVMLCAGMISCDAGDNTTSSTTNATASSENVTTTSAPSEGQKSVISFEQPEYDFGKVESGKLVKHTFKFKNTGSAPLILQNVTASCGCTVPNQWPREPIAPGGTGEIAVEFDSKGRFGAQNKTVTVQSNSDQGTTMLVLRGEVLDDSRGPLRE